MEENQVLEKPALLKASEYALRRGVDAQAVRYAVRVGKLVKSVFPQPDGKFLIDPAIADTEWLPMFDPRRPMLEGQSPPDGRIRHDYSSGLPGASEINPDDPEGERLIPVATSRAKKEAYDAEITRLKLEREKGKLVDAKEVESRWINIASITRTKILGIASKARQRIPELTDAQYDIIDKIVRESLEELRDENVESDEDIE